MSYYSLLVLICLLPIILPILIDPLLFMLLPFVKMILIYNGSKIAKEKVRDLYKNKTKGIPKLEEYKDTYFYKESETLTPKLVTSNKRKEKIILSGTDNITGQLIEEIDTYKNVYTLPEFNFSEKEMSIITDNLYNLLKEYDYQRFTYVYLSKILRITFAKTLVYGDSKIEIANLIDNLSIIKEWGLKEKDVLKMQKNILNEIKRYYKDKDVMFDLYPAKVKELKI